MLSDSSGMLLTDEWRGQIKFQDIYSKIFLDIHIIGRNE